MVRKSAKISTKQLHFHVQFINWDSADPEIEIYFAWFFISSPT